MGDLFNEFQDQLRELSRRYRDTPQRELAYLFLLALEREEIVSVGYRESLIAERLRRMPLSDEVRELIRHSLLWAWKDEEMHAIYIRGAILKFGTVPMKSKAMVTQAAGAIGGWSSSVCQHARWSDAPFSRFAASLFTLAGRATGKVPRRVANQLDYGPFRNFCLFNVDAEKTAWLCWHRMAELTENSPFFPKELHSDFLRIEADETRHEKIFQVLADALDEEDRLTPAETCDSLAERLSAAGEFFLPRSRRTAFIKNNPLGSGGTVFVSRGKTAADKVPKFYDFLEYCKIFESVQQRAGQIGKSIDQFRVAVKPTFMLGYAKKDLSPLTDPDLLHELAAFLKSKGCAEVSVIESPNIYDKFYANRSVAEVAEYFSLYSRHYNLVDVSRDHTSHDYIRGLGQTVVSRTWKEADFRISFGKMRSHPIELALLTVGNLEGIGSRCEEFIFVERQAHRETAVMTLISDFPPHFALLDAYLNVPDGILGVMGCPQPKNVLRFYGGADALAVDIVAARHLGIKDPHQSSILRAACHWFGDSQKIEVVGCDEPIRNWRSPYHNELSTLLCFMAFPVYVIGSGRGSLFVPEMDPSAFPPLQKEHIPLKLARKTLQAFLGLRLS
ncbi:DUF362 domain-containing protein [bacterium]|nr:DUF362 domain-containing protein [bacterium]